jgi:hypothetical protein
MTTSWNTFPWFHSSSHNCCHIKRLHQDHRRVHRRLQGNNYKGHRCHQDHNSRHGSGPCQTSRDLHQEDHFSGHLRRQWTMATASKTQHGTGRHDHRKGGKARTTRVELEQSQPMTKMQDQLQQEESTGQHRQQHGNSPCSQRTTDVVNPLGGNRYSAPRHNARRQQHNRERMQSQWGRGRRDDDGDVSSDPEQRLRRLSGNLQDRDKDRAKTRKSKR